MEAIALGIAGENEIDVGQPWVFFDRGRVAFDQTGDIFVRCQPSHIEDEAAVERQVQALASRAPCFFGIYRLEA